ncbi:MAG: hypothetical protein KDA24_10860 [Deltaproteobacteria bacterium]|nr:hypothetical protein [Deltaproteobacteria bacterium]
MAERAPKPRVYVCGGDDCRKRKTDRKKLRKALDAVAVEVSVKCQKVCKGPVVGLEVDGELQWFASVRGKKARGAVLKYVDTGKLGSDLKGRRHKKRTGKLRK